MKKLLVLLFLMIIGTSVYAQKRYVHIQYFYPTSNYDSKISLSGYVPNDMELNYTNTAIGVIVDMLGQRGYVLEQMSTSGTPTSSSGVFRECIIMSISSAPSNQTQIEGDVNNDSEVNIADVNKVISIILGMLRDNPKLLEQLGIEQPK